MGHPCAAPDEETLHLVFLPELSQLVLDLAPLLRWKSLWQLLAHPFTGGFIGRPCDTNRQHTHHGPRGIERSHRCLKARLLTTLPSTEQIILRYAPLLVHHCGSFKGPHPHLLLNPPHNQT